MKHSELLSQFFIEFPIDLFSQGKWIDENLIKVEGKGHSRCVNECLSSS